MGEGGWTKEDWINGDVCDNFCLICFDSAGIRWDKRKWPLYVYLGGDFRYGLEVVGR